jgi:hypothetical protein
MGGVAYPSLTNIQLSLSIRIIRIHIIRIIRQVLESYYASMHHVTVAKTVNCGYYY